MHTHTHIKPSHQQVVALLAQVRILKNVLEVMKLIYKSDSLHAKELTRAVGYFIAKDLMPTGVVQGDTLFWSHS